MSTLSPWPHRFHAGLLALALGVPTLTAGHASSSAYVRSNAGGGGDRDVVLRGTSATTAAPLRDTRPPTGGAAGPELAPVARREPALRFGYHQRCGDTVLAKLETTNQGAGTLRLGKTRLGGEDAEAFAILKDGCSERSILPGARCTIDLRFSAGKDARSSVYEAALTTSTNDPRAEALVTRVEARPLGTGCDARATRD
jgi:hypothetical protein